MKLAEAARQRQRQLQPDGNGGTATAEAAVSAVAVVWRGGNNMAAVGAAQRWRQLRQNGGGGGSATGDRGGSGYRGFNGVSAAVSAALVRRRQNEVGRGIAAEVTAVSARWQQRRAIAAVASLRHGSVDGSENPKHGIHRCFSVFW
jgi:hypothetical protein